MSKGQKGKTAEQIQEGEKRLLQAYEIYNNLAKGKIADFEKIKNYLAQTLENMLAEGSIGPGVILASRIKSPASVVQNWKLGKDLNDIFGITLLTATQQEMDEIRARLRKEKKFNITSKKKMNEKRGYEAIHFLFNVGDEKNKTKIECHMQTHEKYISVYPHVLYKARRKLRRDLTEQEEEQIQALVQEMYEEEKLVGQTLSNGRNSNVLQMWVTSFNQQGKMEEQELTDDMILTIMYPFLDISKKQKQRHQESNQTDEEAIEL